MAEDKIVKDKKIILLAIAAITAMSVAASATAAISVPTGWYVEGNGGTSKTSDVNPAGTSLDGKLTWVINLCRILQPKSVTHIMPKRILQAEQLSQQTLLMHMILHLRGYCLFLIPALIFLQKSAD